LSLHINDEILKLNSENKENFYVKILSTDVVWPDILTEEDRLK